MYPNVAYFLNDYFGYPIKGYLSVIQTFGLFISLCYTITALLILFEIKSTHEKFVPHLTELTQLTVLLFFSTILGSNLFSYLDSNKGILVFNFLGGFTGCITSCYFYCLYKKINFLRIVDLSSYPLLLGYAIGRLGCHLSGDGDWGIINIHPPPQYWILPKHFWAYDYPHNVLRKGVLIKSCEGQYCYILDTPVFPTSLYEFIICLFLGLIFFLVKKCRKLATGSLFSAFLILLGIERFLIEFIKINPKQQILGFSLSQSQICSLIMIFIAIGLILNLPSQIKPKDSQ